MMYSLEQLLNADTNALWALTWARKPLKKKWLKHIIALAMDYLLILLSVSEEKSLCEWSESFTGLDSSQMIVDCPLNIDR
jgi:hypothetical protein